MTRRWLILLSVASFGSSAFSLSNGDFIGSDLPEKVHFDHLIANSIESLGWLTVFLLYATRHAPWAGRLGLFLVGMWLWDMTTTLPLSLPLPPLQNIWGPATLLIQIYAIQPLLKGNSNTRSYKDS